MVSVATVAKEVVPERVAEHGRSRHSSYVPPQAVGGGVCPQVHARAFRGGLRVLMEEISAARLARDVLRQFRA